MSALFARTIVPVRNCPTSREISVRSAGKRLNQNGTFGTFSGVEL